MPSISAVIGIAAVAVVITALIVWNVAISYRKKVVESKIGSAEEKAREIIDEAVKTAETKKREGLLEVKEEALRNKIKYNGMTVMTIGIINDYIQTEKTYIKGQIIRLENLDNEYHVAKTIAKEINQGIYI